MYNDKIVWDKRPVDKLHDGKIVKLWTWRTKLLDDTYEVRIKEGFDSHDNIVSNITIRFVATGDPIERCMMWCRAEDAADSALSAVCNRLEDRAGELTRLSNWIRVSYDHLINPPKLDLNKPTSDAVWTVLAPNYAAWNSGQYGIFHSLVPTENHDTSIYTYTIIDRTTYETLDQFEYSSFPGYVSIRNRSYINFAMLVSRLMGTSKYQSYDVSDLLDQLVGPNRENVPWGVLALRIRVSPEFKKLYGVNNEACVPQTKEVST